MMLVEDLHFVEFTFVYKSFLTRAKACSIDNYCRVQHMYANKRNIVFDKPNFWILKTFVTNHGSIRTENVASILVWTVPHVESKK